MSVVIASDESTIASTSSNRTLLPQSRTTRMPHDGDSRQMLSSHTHSNRKDAPPQKFEFIFHSGLDGHGRNQVVKKKAMAWYLETEAQNPGSNDPRVQKRKRDHQALDEAESKTLQVPHADWASSSISSDNSESESVSRPLRRPRIEPFTSSQPLQPFKTTSTGESSPSSSSLEENERRKAWDQTLLSQPTSNAGTFNALPTFKKWSTSDTAFMKDRCIRIFCTPGLKETWTPLLMQADHTFLSALVITITFDEVMRKSLRPNHSIKPFGTQLRNGDNRLQAITDVISLTKEALLDPQGQVRNTAIASVLQILQSEIMNGDDDVLQTHQKGLHQMIYMRGGLKQLGNAAPLAREITMSIHLAAILRERPVRGEYRNYIARHCVGPDHLDRLDHEAPLFEHELDMTVTKTRTPAGIFILELLFRIRQLTEAVHTMFRPQEQAPGPRERCILSGSDIRAAIFAIPALRERWPTSTRSSYEEHMYEALRLTARIYASALVQKIPFSSAAFRLSTASHSKTIWMQIMQELSTTDLGQTWDEYQSILFFIALVAGASTNTPPSTPSAIEDHRVDCKRFFSAIAVQCSIRTSFQNERVAMNLVRQITTVRTISQSTLLLPRTGALAERGARQYNPDATACASPSPSQTPTTPDQGRSAQTTSTLQSAHTFSASSMPRMHAIPPIIPPTGNTASQRAATLFPVAEEFWIQPFGPEEPPL